MLELHGFGNNVSPMLGGKNHFVHFLVLLHCYLELVRRVAPGFDWLN